MSAPAADRRAATARDQHYRHPTVTMLYTYISCLPTPSSHSEPGTRRRPGHARPAETGQGRGSSTAEDRGHWLQLLQAPSSPTADAGRSVSSTGQRTSTRHRQTAASQQCTLINPLTPTVVPYGYSYIKHPVPNRVKPSFVIFDIRAQQQPVKVPGCQKLQMTA